MNKWIAKLVSADGLSAYVEGKGQPPPYLYRACRPKLVASFSNTTSASAEQLPTIKRRRYEFYIMFHPELLEYREIEE